MPDALAALIGGLLLATGLLLASVGLYGMFRKREIFDQLHAAGLVTGPGVILVLLASVATGRAETITSAILVIAFVLVTASLSTHIIADAAWRRRAFFARMAARGDASAAGTPAGRLMGAASTGDPAGRAVLRRIVLSYDGSPAADLACDLTASLAWPAGAVIEVVGVQDADLPALTPTAAEAGAGPHEAEALRLEGALRGAAERIAGTGVTVEWRRLSGDPASAIVNHARAVAADLVITGSRGLGYRSILLGSVANEVVDRAPCPVLVARSSAMQSVLVPTNGSPASAAALDLIARWPIFESATVRVLSVATGEPSYTGRPGTNPMAGARDESDQQRIAEAATTRLIAAGRRALPSVGVGDATAQIVAHAGSVDLIVIGSRGRTGLSRALLGSVARGVLLSTETSVLIVRRDMVQTTEKPDPA
jgi:monovalent cation/proton antiporter MnhG/PhaG subunit